MANPERIDVMVCLATVTPPNLVQVQVSATATVADAVRASGLLEEVGLSIDACRLGVYGKRKAPDAPLHAHDRVEITGPLIADPKTARRRRVRRVRATGTREGLKWLRNEAPPEDDVAG
ncbi:RnfH family protein [Ralstonia pseudosolanacearum]|uniref:RnfH family protein n=1 Tax=Ralstonia pseudosolanacearum TaxID=1310165 RepID=UPI00267591CB|nr:RnfH family protein [Ralstonia pseudosolanacearum]MDO3506595.1 RnfH family protein [Ralstonia pseudosolanacearum]MDO3511166.1 RnfH family protein [Ralstonia pseudosolanacearum]MDO3523259.1 RnfH family protein [Ralstonia pseudosolanacearum]MDO3536047.1 RnfH family protein [Ralstonia pseudosolanacearum]MDO3547185.1 RnfH family protein [Ralstonia pseudosolanacearum]